MQLMNNNCEPGNDFMKNENLKTNSSSLGCINLITGNGKGKTTSALGIALRAAGHGFKILMIQFMKKGWDYGELKAAEYLPNFQIVQYGTPDFINKKSPLHIDFREARAGLAYFKKEMEKEWDIIILDEINMAIDYQLIPEDEVLDLLSAKPKNLEVILTGRYATKALFEIADYYTIVESKKHPYQQNINARKGVEY